MYREAPDTVSVSIVTEAPLGLNPAAGPAGRLSLTKGNKYVNCVELTTPWTFVVILKSATLTFLILIGVSAVNPCGAAVVTVITLPGVAPSPARIAEILIGSVLNAPTISHSGLCLENESPWSGYFWSISRFYALLYALETLLYYISRSDKSYPDALFTPSAYSNTVSLWWENVGLAWLVSEKFWWSVYTFVSSLPSKILNCQK